MMIDREKNINKISSASMKTLLAYTREIMFMKDMNFIYIGASQAFAELVGLSHPSDLIGKTDFDIFQNKELAKRYREDDERMLEKGVPLLEYVEPIPSKDGGSRYCSTSKYIITDDEGKPIGLFGASRDITREYEAKLNYERELGFLFQLPANALFSVLFDVSSWRVVDFRFRDKNNHVVSRYDTIEIFMERAAALVVKDEDVRRFFESFSIKTVNKIFESGKRLISMEYMRFATDGTVIWVREDFHFLTDPVSGHLSVLCVVRDIDKEKREKSVLPPATKHNSNSLKELNVKLQSENQSAFFNDSKVEEIKKVRISKSMSEGKKYELSEAYDQISRCLTKQDYEFVSLIEADSGIVSVNIPRNSDVFLCPEVGIEYEPQLDRFASAAVFPRDLKDFLKAMSLSHVISMLEQYGKYDALFAFYSIEKQIRYKEWCFLWLDDNHNTIIMTRSDITELAEIERDQLTGLYNRQAFCRHVRERLDAEPNTRFLIARWDVDRFKVFNDMFGSNDGDYLLKSIGMRLLNEQEPDRIYGRFEADHFVALIPVEGSQLEIWNLLQEKALKDHIGGFRLSMSIGVYIVQNTDIDVSLMCDRALLALRTVKNGYEKKVAIFDESMRSELLEEQVLLDDFEQAINKEQFQIFFQPQVNYETNSIIGAEALVRWEHPSLGLITPNRFIPLFEKKGYITRLDKYVWEKSCAYLRSWRNRKDVLSQISVSVNISRMDIYDPMLCETLKSLIKKYDLPISSLKLEITENAYMENPEQLINVVVALQSMGFTVEMDDFGAGYSSLNMLKDVPVDILKLDVQFLSKGIDDSRGGNILSSILRMAHWLKLPVIAEGVENGEYANYLKSIGCVNMQGYYFSKPMPAVEFEKLLEFGNVSTTNPYSNVNIEGMGAFWDSSTQMTLLFNSFVGGAAILEYRGGEVEILRANDKFYMELETTREKYLSKQCKTLERFDEENRTRYIEMLDEAIHTKNEADCEIKSLPQDEGECHFWTHNRVRLLVQNVNSYLFYLSVENITTRKEMEENERLQSQELRKSIQITQAEEERVRLIINHLHAISFTYDCGEDMLSYQTEHADEGQENWKVEHFLSTLESNIIVHPDYTALCRSTLNLAVEKPMQGTFEYISMTVNSGYRWCRNHYASLADESGRVYRVVGLIYDIQNEKDREAIVDGLTVQLGRRNKALAFDSAVIERVFSRLYEAKDVDSTMHSVLQTIGQHYGASRAYIFEDSVDHEFCVNTFEWCAHGIISEKENLQHVSYLRDLGGTYLENFSSDGVFYCPDISRLPESQYNVVASQGIKAMLQCAILDNGVFCGFIGFDDCSGSRVWTEEEVGTLAMVSKMIGAFLIKVRLKDGIWALTQASLINCNDHDPMMIDGTDITDNITKQEKSLHEHK